MNLLEYFAMIIIDYLHLISTTDSLPISKSIILTSLVTNLFYLMYFVYLYLTCILIVYSCLVLSFSLCAILFTRPKRWRAPRVTSITCCRRATCLYIVHQRPREVFTIPATLFRYSHPTYVQYTMYFRNKIQGHNVIFNEHWLIPL